MKRDWEKLEARLITPLLIDETRQSKGYPCPSPPLMFDELVEANLTDAAIGQAGISKAEGDKYLFMRMSIVASAKSAEIHKRIQIQKINIMKSCLPNKIKGVIDAIDKLNLELSEFGFALLARKNYDVSLKVKTAIDSEMVEGVTRIQSQNPNNFEKTAADFADCMSDLSQHDYLSRIEALDKTFKALKSQAEALHAPITKRKKLFEKVFLSEFARCVETLIPDQIHKDSGFFPDLAAEALKEAGHKLPSGPEHQISEMLHAIKQDPTWDSPQLSNLRFSRKRVDGPDGFEFVPNNMAEYHGPTLRMLGLLDD